MKMMKMRNWWEEISITAEMRRIAHSWADGNQFRTDIKDRDTRYIGALGVLAFLEVCKKYGIKTIYDDTPEYDVLLLLSTGDLKIEVKAMSWYKIPEKNDVYLNARMRIQNCDYYVFVCIDTDDPKLREKGKYSREKARVLGFLSKDDYSSKVRVSEQGTKERYLVNGTDFKNYVIDFGQINPIGQFRNLVDDKIVKWG